MITCSRLATMHKITLLVFSVMGLSCDEPQSRPVTIDAGEADENHITDRPIDESHHDQVSDVSVNQTDLLAHTDDEGMPQSSDQDVMRQDAIPFDQGDVGVSPVPIMCDDGNPCTVESLTDEGRCVTRDIESGPCLWPGRWTMSTQNPIHIPTDSSPDQGADNIYAPDIIWHQDRWWMWYGGQGTDGHDVIFLSWSTDLVTWQKYPTWSTPLPVVDHGRANHVNDPSVVYVNDTFYMYYTEAMTGEDDRVHLATSIDGIHWIKQGIVIDVGTEGAWDRDRVGRPAVIYEKDEFRMWYDGQIVGVARHVGYATSPDGYQWTKYEHNPVVLNEGAVDVDRVDDQYVLLAESHQGTKLYVADSPLAWHFVGLLLELSGQPYDSFGQVTPHLVVRDRIASAIFLGGASDQCWCHNRIAIALMADDISGCHACLNGQDSCQAACEAHGTDFGFCAEPGSTDPNACCACCDQWACAP